MSEPTESQKDQIEREACPTPGCGFYIGGDSMIFRIGDGSGREGFTCRGECGKRLVRDGPGERWRLDD